MLNASPRFKQSLGGAVRFVTSVEYSNGAEWVPLRLHSGSVTRSYTSTVHWSMQLSVSGAEVALDQLQAFNTRVRIRHGIAFGPGDVELLPFGLYVVTGVSESLSDETVDIQGVSYEHFLINATYTRPRTYRSDSAAYVLGSIVGEVLPESRITWAEGVDGSTLLPEIVAERERWGLIDGSSQSQSIANAVGGRVIADAFGNFEVVPVPTLQDQEVWRLGSGHMLINHTRELNSADVFNSVVVTGASVEGLTVGPVVVEDNDPLSPTYVRRPITAGGFGRKPFFYESQLLTSLEQCEKTAKALLAQRLGARQQVSFDSLHNPLLEPGDVIVAKEHRVILDSVTYDLSGAPLQATTRTTATRLMGDVTEVVVEGEEGETT